MTTKESELARLTKRLEVIQGLRRAFEKFRKHEKFTKRAQKIIEQELPKNTVYVKGSGSGPFASEQLSIWGNGIDYDDSVTLYSIKPGPEWVASFEESLNRMDPTDQLERLNQEAEIAKELLALNATAARLMDELKKVREEAQKRIEQLPIPPTATKTGMRDEPHFWSQPSRTATETYPTLFDTLKG